SYMEIEQKFISKNNLIDIDEDLSELEIIKNNNSNTLNYNYLIKSDTLVLSNSILAVKNKLTKKNDVSIKVYLLPTQKLNLNGNDRKYILHSGIEHGNNYYMFNNQDRLQNTKDTIN